MKPTSPSPQRVATIEIGSRAIRLLIAEISESGVLRVLNSGWRETGLAAALAEGGATLDAKIAEIIQLARAFEEKGQTYSVTRRCIFATEAVRQMSGENLAKWRHGIPRLEVIDGKTEACCALLGALSPFQSPKPTGLNFVIDQGSASMELALGAISEGGVDLKSYKSYRLGTQELVNDLRECGGDFRALQRKVCTQIKALKLPKVYAELQPIILGSAATKIAWMMVRRNALDRYDSAVVHGQIVELAAVEKLIAMAIAAPDAIRGAVDSANPTSMEFETVISGLVSLSTFLNEFRQQTFKVSAYGPRHGVLWMTALYHKLGYEV